MQLIAIVGLKAIGRTLSLMITFFKSSFLLNFSLFLYFSPFPSTRRVARAPPRTCYYIGVGQTLVFTRFFYTSSFGLKIVSRNEQGFCHFFIKCKMLGMFKSNSNQSNREQEIRETFIPLETALFPFHFYRSIDVFCLLWHQKQLFQTSGIFLPFKRIAYIGCESNKMDFSFTTLHTATSRTV